MRLSDHAIIWESSRDPIAAIASHCDRYLVKIKYKCATAYCSRQSFVRSVPATLVRITSPQLKS